MTDTSKSIKIPYTYWEAMGYFIPVARLPGFNEEIFIPELVDTPEEVSKQIKDMIP